MTENRGLHIISISGSSSNPKLTFEVTGFYWFIVCKFVKDKSLHIFYEYCIHRRKTFLSINYIFMDELENFLFVERKEATSNEMLQYAALEQVGHI